MYAMLRAIIKIGTFVLIVVLVCSIGYSIGYFNGVNDSILFEKAINASENIHVIEYIGNNQLDKAKSIQFSSLEANIAAIDDISKNKCKISKIPSRLIAYRELLSLDMEGKIAFIREKYKDLLSKKEGCAGK